MRMIFLTLFACGGRKLRLVLRDVEERRNTMCGNDGNPLDIVWMSGKCRSTRPLLGVGVRRNPLTAGMCEVG